MRFKCPVDPNRRSPNFSAMSHRYVVIMAGGRGERFWPQSRLQRPKHLLPIVGNKAMLAQTLDRLSGLVPPQNIFILTSRDQQAAVRSVCPQLPPEQVIGEPMGRDTAAAVGLAQLLIRRKNPRATWAMLPADHVIHDGEGFRATVATAFAAAERDNALVTIGIRPSYPSTGFGYLHRGAALDAAENRPVFRVSRFVEKPDRDRARQYVDSGEYLWNAGMFAWTVESLGTAFAKHAPRLAAAFTAIDLDLDHSESLDSVLDRHYPQLDKISVDYAIMEKAERVEMVEAAFDWDDVGEWSAIARHCAADERENVVRGQAVIEDGRANIVVGENGHLIALLGVDDLIVVQTAGATMVCKRDRAQDVKKLVQRIQTDPNLKSLL